MNNRQKEIEKKKESKIPTYDELPPLDLYKNKMTQKQKEIEKEFDEADFLRGNCRGDLNYISENQRRNIKNFIFQKLSQNNKEWEECLGEWMENTSDGADGWNDCLAQIKAKAKEKGLI